MKVSPTSSSQCLNIKPYTVLSRICIPKATEGMEIRVKHLICTYLYYTLKYLKERMKILLQWNLTKYILDGLVTAKGTLKIAA